MRRASPIPGNRSPCCAKQPPPYAFGYVLLDGADTAIGGFFKGVDLTDPATAAQRLKIGTPIVTRFAEQRRGDVLDFWFEVA
jgi:uncharacterized protein